MPRPLRHPVVLAGGAAGLISGLLVLSLVPAQRTTAGALMGPGDFFSFGMVAPLLLSALVGMAFASVFRHQAQGYAASVSSGLLSGLLWWIGGSLTLAPLLGSGRPTWSLADAAAAFPSLVGDLLYGGVTGLLFVVFLGLLRRREPEPGAVATRAQPAAQRVLILGGGFGGVAAAQRLERSLARDPGLEITLISASNALLFTPMLAEVAAGALEPQHISAPLRAACPRTRVHRAEVAHIDLAGRTVQLAGHTDDAPQQLGWDHLVLALGGVPSYHDLPGVEQHAFPLKTLGDATALRGHVIALLEEADQEADQARRRSLLTFVVAGGGYSGTETVAELQSLVRDVARYYPGVGADEPRFVLVHSRDRILPEIGEGLAAYALDELRARGIEFLLEERIAGATAEQVLLEGGDAVSTRTLVWTAGNQPHPVLATMGLELAKSGAVPVTPTLQVEGHDNLWAVGDCAQVPDPDGGHYPPTAQHALREGRAAAANVLAVLRGGDPVPFTFAALGTLVALGHRTAVAELRGLRFSGRIAWVLWRAIYLAKLPGLERQLRVAFDWALESYFPRDIVLEEPSARRLDQAGRGHPELVVAVADAERVPERA